MFSIFKVFPLYTSNPTPIGTTADYGSSTVTHHVVIERAANFFFPPDLLNRLWNLPSVTILDLGCAKGTNSPFWLTPILESYSRSDTKPPLSIVYCDLQESNREHISTFCDSFLPFSELGITYSFQPGSFLNSSVFPKHSFDLIFSSVAFHWLTAPPTTLDSKDTVDGHHRADYKEQADTEWRTILANVTSWLKPYGYFVTTNLSTKMDINTRHPVRHGDHIYKAISQIAKDMKLPAFTIPTYKRSPDEFLTPFRNHGWMLPIVPPTPSPTPLPSSSPLTTPSSPSTPTTLSYTVPCQVYQKYLKGEFGELNSEAAKKSFSEHLSQSIRAWLRPIIISQCKNNDKTEEFFTRLSELFATNPEHYAFDFICFAFCAQKQPD